MIAPLTLARGRFLCTVQPRLSGLGLLFRWSVVDNVSGATRSGLASTVDAAGLEATTAVKELRS